MGLARRISPAAGALKLAEAGGFGLERPPGGDLVKILHVVSQLTPGGAEKVVLELAGYQAKMGHDVTVLAPYDIGAVQVYVTPPDVKLDFLLPSPTGKRAVYAALLRHIIAQRRHLRTFDVIHCHLTLGAVFGVLFRTFNGRTGPVLIETNHSAGMPMNDRVRWLRSHMARRFDEVALVVEDSFWRQQGKSLGFPVSLIANGINMEAFARIERRPAAPGGKRTVGTVGMFRADRVPHVYVEIFKAVARQYAGGDLDFLWVGGGVGSDALMNEVRAAVQASDIGGRVTFFGVSRLPAEQAARMDVFVSLNVGPLTGLGGIEAAAVGTPLVGYQMDPGYVMSDNDWIWSSQDIELVAARVVELLRDEPAAQAVASSQRSHVNEHYSLNTAYAAYNAMYLRHLEGKNA